MKNKNIVWTLALGLLTMICLTYASVPLYRLFCQMTGYGGTARIFVPPSNITGTKTIKVAFNADTEPKLQWLFKPQQRYVDVITGENKLIFYEAENLTD